MRFRSTGLGRVELIAEFMALTHDKETSDCVILHLNSTAPVRWKMSATLEGRDVARLVWLLMKGWYWLIPYLFAILIKSVRPSVFRAKAKGDKAEAIASAKEVGK